MQVQLFLVAFRLESGPPALVTLVDAQARVPHVTAGPDAAAGASRLLSVTWDQIGSPLLATSPQAELVWDSQRPEVVLAGVDDSGQGVTLIYTAPITCPLAEIGLDVAAGSPYGWRTLNESVGRRSKEATPIIRRGPEAIVLDYWRQAFEETDAVLDVLPPNLTLLQIRGVYDAVWGYDQDPSGFKRWAVDRPGAFQSLLTEVTGEHLDVEFYRALARVLPPEVAAEAGALTRGPLRATSLNGLGPAIALAAATTANRLFPRPGPEAAWYARSPTWRGGPTWIENLYPPRPAWTRWDVGTD